MENTLVQFVMTEKASFRDFANAVVSDLLRIAIQQQITAPLAQGLLGFGGGRASGGSVSGGIPYLVGERGPEMFVPDTSGSIVPNRAANNVVVNVINQTGIPVKAQSNSSFDGEKWVQEIILKGIDSYGPLRNAIAGVR